MTTTTAFEILLLSAGLWFTYIGAMTLFSKDYYLRRVEKLSAEDADVSGKSLPRWRVIYTRYALGAKWLALGLTSLGLITYRVIVVWL